MELWDVYDGNGIKTGKTKQRHESAEEGEYRLVSSLWIINQEGKALIQKRALTKKVNPGDWNITGGSSNAGETSEEACIREVFEEIGLEVDIRKLKLLTRKFVDKEWQKTGLSDRGIIFDNYIIVSDFNIEDAKIQPQEVSELKWVTVDELIDIHDTGAFMFSHFDEEIAKVADYIKSRRK